MRFNTNSRDGGESDGAETDNTRRRFMAGTAGALGTVALGSAFATPTFAQEGSGDGQEGRPPTENVTEDQFESDLAILNYALTLEYLEAEFYMQGLENLSAGDIRNAEMLQDFGSAVTGRLVGDLATIRDHEVTHADTLAATIEKLGGTPTDKPTFDFGGATENADKFLATAMVLENTGVGAYAGAAPSIENQDLVPPALSIHSVEARHASYLNLLNGKIPFPEPFDDPLSKTEVLNAASAFIVDESSSGGGGADDSGGC